MGDGFDRVHDRLDGFQKRIEELSVKIERLTTTIDLSPKVPARPCPDFVAHVEEHKAAALEKRGALAWVAQTVLAPALTAAGLLAAAWFGLKGQ